MLACFPRDVLLEICNHLDAKCVSTLITVCKKFELLINYLSTKGASRCTIHHKLFVKVPRIGLTCNYQECHHCSTTPLFKYYYGYTYLKNDGFFHCSKKHYYLSSELQEEGAFCNQLLNTLRPWRKYHEKRDSLVSLNLEKYHEKQCRIVSSYRKNVCALLGNVESTYDFWFLESSRTGMRIRKIPMQAE